MRFSLRTLLLFTTVCTVFAASLPAVIKQSRKHLVYSRYIAAMQGRKVITERCIQAKRAGDFDDVKIRRKLQLEFEQAKDRIVDRLEAIYKYSNDYDLDYDEIAADHAVYVKKRN